MKNFKKFTAFMLAFTFAIALLVVPVNANAKSKSKMYEGSMIKCGKNYYYIADNTLYELNGTSLKAKKISKFNKYKGKIEETIYGDGNLLYVTVVNKAASVTGGAEETLYSYNLKTKKMKKIIDKVDVLYIADGKVYYTKFSNKEVKGASYILYEICGETEFDEERFYRRVDTLYTCSLNGKSKKKIISLDYSPYMYIRWERGKDGTVYAFPGSSAECCVVSTKAKTVKHSTADKFNKSINGITLYTSDKTVCKQGYMHFMKDMAGIIVYDWNNYCYYISKGKLMKAKVNAAKKAKGTSEWTGKWTTVFKFDKEITGDVEGVCDQFILVKYWIGAEKYGYSIYDKKGNLIK